MRFTGIALTNWKNFQSLDLPLRETMYIVGENAVGKSNLLDAFRFLHDLAKDGGGLQKALQDRQGLSKVRSLFARTNPEVTIRVVCEQTNTTGEQDVWSYELAMRTSAGGSNPPYVEREVVFKNGKIILNRPDDADRDDDVRRRQTALEQINSNKEFRELAEFFKRIDYLHLVPQLVKYGAQIQGNRLEDDPFGQGFLEKIASTSENTRKSRLERIQSVLKSVVPQFSDLVFERDAIRGTPHLKAKYDHWRPQGGWQEEVLFSDGTLRLIGLFWSLLETGVSAPVLLLEEPEISLNDEIIKNLPLLFYKVAKSSKSSKQLLISTHSRAMLHNESIDATRIIILKTGKEGTQAQIASAIPEVVEMIQAGYTPAEAIFPASSTIRPEQLSFLSSLI